jgi:hypothetical protein
LDVTPESTFILLRGSPGSLGTEVKPDFPSLFCATSPTFSESVDQQGQARAENQESWEADATEQVERYGPSRSVGRRRVLADWLASDENWMTARVIVNRIWLQYFGRGIVRSPNNFGLMGELPTHPELLDYLASELVRNGWSLKSIHRQILLSATYRRSSANIERSQGQDPANNLFWRQNVRRLSAEQVRDGVLSLTGQLNCSQFGSPIYPDLAAEVLASQSQPGRNWEKSSQAEQARRSIYIHVKRSLPVPLMTVFDFPETDSTCEARFLTVQPGQALSLLNSQWIQDQADRFKERLAREVGEPIELQAARALQLVSGENPKSADIDQLVTLYQTLKSDHLLDDRVARRCVCVVVLNLNQFVYLD